MGGIDSWFDDLDEKKVTMDNHRQSNTARYGTSGTGSSSYAYS